MLLEGGDSLGDTRFISEIKEDEETAWRRVMGMIKQAYGQGTWLSGVPDFDTTKIRGIVEAYLTRKGRRIEAIRDKADIDDIFADIADALLRKM